MPDTQTEIWKPIPGYSIRYQASTEGLIRNRNGIIMQPRPNGSGYLQLNLVDDEGVTRTVTVHKCILRTFRGECPPGMEACHGPGGQLDNRLANLEWGPIPDNRREPSPRRPVRPPKIPAPCVRCGEPVTKGGRRCHACVVEIGREAARMMREGARLGDANERLEYANAEYLHVLAVKYGGWGHCQPCSCSPSATVTLRDRLRRRFGKRASDAP